jgi:hypothetical protein
MGIPLFDVLNAVNEKKPYIYKKKDCSAFMLVMWLSHDPALIGICNDINPYIFSMSDDMIYRYFLKRVPKKKRYLKWTKKLASSKSKEKDIKVLMDKYELSKREAELSVR